MKDTKKRSVKAAKEILGVFEAHFAKLPAKERVKRERAFDKALSNIGSGAKPEARVSPRATQGPSLPR